jgi:hypothetical protein
MYKGFYDIVFINEYLTIRIYFTYDIYIYINIYVYFLKMQQQLHYCFIVHNLMRGALHECLNDPAATY